MPAIARTIEQVATIARRTRATYYVRRAPGGQYVATVTPPSGPYLAIVRPNGSLEWTNN